MNKKTGIKKRISDNSEKIIKTSTKILQPTKDIEKLLGYANDETIELDYVSFKEMPKFSDKAIIKIGRELVQWAQDNHDALKLHSYFRERGISYETVARWRRRVPQFDTLCLMALSEIGDRREKAAYHKVASEQLVIRTMALYDQDYRSFLEWNATINKQDPNSNKETIVVLDRYSDPKDESTKS